MSTNPPPHTQSSSATIIPPSSSDLERECRELPPGWVVAWSRSQQRRYWCRKPTATLREIKQWTPPDEQQRKEAETYAQTQNRGMDGNHAQNETTSRKRRAEEQETPTGADEPAQQRQRTNDDRPNSSSNDSADHVDPFSAAVAAAHATVSSTASIPIVPVQLPSEPNRILYATPPDQPVANPPVYATSMQAMSVLNERGSIGNVESEWFDAERFDMVLKSSKLIIVNNIYADKDVSLIRPYLSADIPLPPPPQRDFQEEPPALIQARRNAFKELDLRLSQFCKDIGLYDQPSMAYLRWSFDQRSLQHPLMPADPLIPMQPSMDACLIYELQRSRTRKDVRQSKPKIAKHEAEDVARKLADACKEQAPRLLKLSQRMMNSAAVVADIKKFTLLFPHEAHILMSGRSTSAAAPYSSSSSSSSSSSQSNHSTPYQPTRDYDPRTQNIKDQYHIVYDMFGPSHWSIPLNRERFDQLVRDYSQHTQPVQAEMKEDQLFLRRLWTMLARYDTISGAGYQAALPEESFSLLTRYWGVTHECYASPLNHCLESYGSAFIETDRFFGSKGSFLDQRPLEGGFEANPPFLEEVMAPMAMHVLALLERAQAAGTALCFAVVWPGWDDTPAYDLLMSSRFMRQLIVFAKGDHSYKEGLQHRVTTKRYRRSEARSFVLFMQTDEAVKRWPCTEEKLNQFKQSFMKER